MLAGERFSDRPRCVDPLIAAFLRTLNDRLAPRERQRLLPYASAAVNTRGSRRARRARRRICLAATSTRRPFARPLIALFIGLTPALLIDEGIGEFTARHFVTGNDVESALSLLDALIGGPSEPPPLPLAVEDLAELRVTGARAPLVLEA